LDGDFNACTISANGHLISLREDWKMGAVTVILLIMFFCLPTRAQQSAPTPTTISGCLMGMNGAFTLTTSDGQRYILKGDHDTMFSYNGKQVQIKGKAKSTKKTPSKPATFQVSDIKKLADFCQ